MVCKRNARAEGSPEEIAAIRRGFLMKRLFVALVASIVSSFVLAAAAVAVPPMKDEFSVVGDQFRCGQTVLTIRTGTVVERTHVHSLKNGLFRVITISKPKNVTATIEGVPLEEADVYRIVGVGKGNFTTPNPDVEGGEVGFFRVKLNIVGPGSLFGNVDFSVRAKKNGQEIEQNRGTCDFVE